MTHKKTLLAMAALVGGLLFAPGMAVADEARVHLNVRTGPGTGYAAFDVLRPGENVRVIRRSGGWCYVAKAGRDGWVSCRYLTDSDGPIRRGDRDADVSIQFSIPGFSLSFGDRGFFIDRPPRRDRRDRVCFYEHVNYEGDRFCMRPGQRERSLGAWNDRISSIRVRGGAEALVCEHNNFNGRCVVIDRNVRNLGRRGNDIISSIRVR